jgi:sarcosine oxidase subunit gamma
MRDLLAPSASAADAIAGLSLERRPDLALAMLRSHRARAMGSAARVGLACGLPAPLRPNTTSERGEVRLSWIEPGAWLFAGPPAEVRAAVDAIEAANAQPFVLAAEVSAARMAFEIGGPRARALIATGCPLDLHPMRAGHCASSLFNDMAVWIDQLTDEPKFRILCDRALASGLWAQLGDAAHLLA